MDRLVVTKMRMTRFGCVDMWEVCWFITSTNHDVSARLIYPRDPTNATNEYRKRPICKEQSRCVEWNVTLNGIYDAGDGMVLIPNGASH